MDNIFEKYGQSCTYGKKKAEAEEIISKIDLMTLPALKNGQTKFFAAEINHELSGKGRFIVNSTEYSPKVGSTKILGSDRHIPKDITKIFPELCNEKFFVATEVLRHHVSQPTESLIVEFLGDNKLREWKVTAVVDLSTREIIDLFEFLESNLAWRHSLSEPEFCVEGVRFGGRGSHFKDDALNELITRSLKQSGSELSTRYLVKNFDKENCLYVEWLKKWGLLPNGEKNFRKITGLKGLKENFNSTKAGKFFNEPITGLPDQWNWLSAIPKERRTIIVQDGQATLPTGETFLVKNVRGPDGSSRGYIHTREDGSVDVFLRRGSRELGFCGWLWAQKKVGEIIAAIDPLDNYEGLSQGNAPIAGRINECIDFSF
ncbi:MAG: hypothetical protein G01um101418_150 [Parcubacteria group bacterium Gr01-1014_18]|nr:MAG: hypothetical protein Greene041636_455 [Parcubacteria group bacterium Greene0416_36]TSC81477.1 MAG: hypothetical protein G01um101418_150 [Parcubacteria group bacterium Gr01-1014_18]TSC99075.1 MAG: hypothetical protein Greene101420_431 [Parcubacteria group bacterium Greene1014_20]TSD07244.1 MAG: hypothetical protein Greene07142_260 [Parcubacteria group bacterium Greene0714_2]